MMEQMPRPALFTNSNVRTVFSPTQGEMPNSESPRITNYLTTLICFLCRPIHNINFASDACLPCIALSIQPGTFQVLHHCKINLWFP